MLVRRRYYTWLIKAYINRWKRTIIYSLLSGILISLAGVFLFTFTVQPFFQKKIQRIGYAGSYTLQTIPETVMNDISYGLTSVDANGQVKPKAASSWEITDNGKQFIFHIRPHQYFHDGEELTAKNINLNFRDVTKKIIDTYTVAFSLTTPYSPFLVTVSKPLFLNHTDGLGEYEVKNIDLNAGYISSMTLQDRNNATYKKIITFYPTEDALKTGFSLGEIDSAHDLDSLQLIGMNFSGWKNVKIKKQTEYDKLTAMFYNNNDSELSNKSLRQALNYALPTSFPEGERAYSPIPKISIYFSQSPNYGIEDMGIAQQLLKSANTSLSKPITITTTQDFVPVAKIVQSRWQKLGLHVNIQIIHSIDDLQPNFQVLLYQILLPRDPDQYTLWHSDQVNNIGHFKNLRIDKLLEDGRVTFDTDKRKTIYADFQKYLIDDVPASFLYFPYNYTITRS